MNHHMVENQQGLRVRPSHYDCDVWSDNVGSNYVFPRTGSGYQRSSAAMTIQDFGGTGELIGAMLVLVTLVYLSIQLRSMNRVA